MRFGVKLLFLAIALARVAAEPAIYGRVLDEADLTGDIEVGSGTGSGEYPSPAAPPPTSPPSAPPAAPPALPSSSPQTVSVAFSASGDVSDYTESVVLELERKFAETAGVAAEFVKVQVTSGSVVITVAIETNSTASSNAVVTALTPAVASPAALQALITVIPALSSVTVSSVTPVSVGAASPSTPPPPKSESSGLGAGAIAGIVIGGLVGLFCLIFIIYKWIVNIRDSPGHAPLSPKYVQREVEFNQSTASQHVVSNKKGNLDVI